MRNGNREWKMDNGKQAMESERRREWGMGNEGKRKLENGKWVMPNGRGNEKWETRDGDDEWRMVNINVYSI